MTISVVIPVYNSADTLKRCLASVAASRRRPNECIVVDDGSTDGSGDVARSCGARVVSVSTGPSGPGNARNAGAAVAIGDVLFFLDADVTVHEDTIGRVEETFATDPTIDAAFGSYDDNPDAADFLSRYKNLFHHFVHQHARGEAVTFWGACGAVRRSVFQALGGFDAPRYPHPSVEDIEFGYRLRSAGHRIVLNKDMQIRHLKRWTMRGLIKTDIFDRGAPWTRLALRDRRLPNDLNLGFSQRLSAFLLCAVVAYLSLIAVFHDALILPLIVALFMVLAGNWSEETPHFQLSPRAQVLTYLLVAAIAVLSSRAGQPRVMPFLGLLVFVLLVDRWTARPEWRLRRAVFAVIVASLIVSVFAILSHFSIRLGAPFLLLVCSIMVINYRFYRFFMRREGVAFTVAVIPFHLLYYLYSVVSFALGICLYVLIDGRRAAPETPRPLSGDPGPAGPTQPAEVTPGTSAAV